MAYNKIEFWNSCDLDDIFYADGFRQMMWLDGDVTANEYTMLEEGKEDGAGILNPSFQRLMKQYKLETIQPEYVLDALYLAMMCDNVWITLEDGEASKCVEFEVQHDGVANGYFKVTMLFTVDYAVKSGCCQNMGLNKCYAPLATPVRARITNANAIYTDPLNNGVHDGYRYLVLTSGAQGAIMRYSTATNGWIDIGETVANNYVWITASGWYNFYDGNGWYRIPQFLSSTNVGGAVWKLTGTGLAKTFIQLSYSDDAGVTWVDNGLPTWVETFKTSGNRITLPLGGAILVRAHCYTHNCDYGYSASYTINT